MSASGEKRRLPAVVYRVFGGLDIVLGAIERALMALTVVVMLVVVGLVASDALGRYLFNAPVFFTVDLVSHYLLPIVMLLPASIVLRKAGHISVDLFASLLPARLYQALIGLGLLATIPVIWVMAYRVTLRTIEAWEGGKVAYGLIPWPLWAELAIYAVVFGLLTARLIHVAATNVLAAVSGDREIAISLLNPHDSPLEEAI